MPAIKRSALTVAKVRTLAKPGAYTDGNGLTLRVDGKGGKRWVQRVSIGGKQRNLGLGGWPGVGLAEARGAAMANQQAIRQGEDPISKRQQAREDARRPAVPTFQQAAEQVIEERLPSWSSERHAKQWSESLRLHVYPTFGGKAVDVIATSDVKAVLTPIWTTKPETATRVRQRMETVFDTAIVEGWRTDNPASKSILKALPRRARLKQHHPALPYADVPLAIQLVRNSTADTATRLAFEFMVLCASRANEVRGMTWEEVDLDGPTWTVPAARMKARREHRVPLSNRAVEILKEAWKLGSDDYVFPSKRAGGKPMSNMAFEMLLRRLDLDATPHGFRSSFRDWVIEQTATPWAVGEAVLAHNLGNSVESAYARTDVFEKRRVLMQQWANFLACVEVLY